MHDETKLSHHIRSHEEALLTNAIRTSPEGLSALLADEFFEFGSYGRIWTKADFLVDGGIGERTIDLNDFSIRKLADDVVLATYRIHDKTTHKHSLRSSIWKHNHDEWQMVFHQGTSTTTE
ncbi:DUF4440 domain-containing protein [Aureibacillus halotolerans]|uniref:DUF4440 domain-containing protein n=1 Tax=Aureibacillus halotolerans TaxID=1508390 RepID=A0A4R6TSK3_9BACI|nr:DUF4440 domain-containing protein [Aureibacillus halotolerans]TDQ36600.1 hypothetical protein EV213_11764 [Aureibacillus halotolerans]